MKAHRHTLHRSSLLSLLVGGVILVQACSSPGDLLQPNPRSHPGIGQNGGSQGEALASSALLRRVACSVVQHVPGGGVRVAILPRQALPFRFIDFDGLPAHGRGSRVALHPVTYKIWHPSSIAAGLGPIVFTCVLPYDRAIETAVHRAARGADSSGVWDAYERAIQGAKVVAANVPDEVLGRRALRDALFPQAAARSVASSAGSLSVTANGGDGYVLASSDTMMPKVAEPAPVVVTAAYTNWWIDNWWAYDRVRRTLSFSDLVAATYQYNDGPNCASESELYLAKQDEANKMEEEANLFKGQNEALAALTCERMPDKSFCADFFIMNDRAGPFGGDNRTFDPDAGWRSSRIQFYMNPSTLQWELKWNSTRLYWYGIEFTRDDSTRLFDPQKDVQITKDAAGVITVNLQLRNSYCPTRDYGCPTINASVQLWPSDAPGGYTAYWKRDGFPSMGLYMLASDRWVELARDVEQISNPFTNFTALIGNWKQSIRMPPGCSLQ